MRFLAQVDNRTLDVTEQVRMMYDGLVNSTDWGSEFLDTETKGAVLAVGHLLGAQIPEPGRDYPYLEKAGFNEPMPDRRGVAPSQELNEWAAEYRAWQARKSAALLKWHAEVAAQEAAKLEEVDL